MGGDTATSADGSGYRDGIYYSKRPPVHIPTDPFLDFNTYTLESGNSDKYLERVALVDAPTGESFTYRELRRRVKCVASGLATDVGVRQGDTVMILSHNSIHYPVLLFAISSVGAVVTAANPICTTEEIVKLARNSKTKYLITVPPLLGVAAILNVPSILIDVGVSDVYEQKSDAPRKATPTALFSDLLKADPRNAPKVVIRQTDTALIMFSSGTTGTMKGVVFSHGNAIASSCQSDEISFKEDEQRTYILTIPTYHLYGMVLIVCAQLKRGSKLVTMPKFEFPKFLSAIERYRVTHAQVVPPIFIHMTKSPLVENYDLSSLEMIGIGAAPTGKDMLIACAERFKGVFVREGYALTESGGMGTRSTPDSTSPRYGSVGTLVPNVEAKIIDLESGKPLPPNHEGEVLLRGPSNMQGYLNNEKATAETLDREGWLHTGDLGYFTDDGRLYIVDRIKELIKYNGYQVAPAELEAILGTHSEIWDAAVVGFPDELAGQIPVAFVVRKNSFLSEADVMRFIANQVAPFKKVRKVFFVDIIPKSASGKILRRELRPPTLATSKL